MSNGQSGILDLLQPAQRPQAPGGPPRQPSPGTPSGILDLLPAPVDRTRAGAPAARPTVESSGYRVGIGEELYRQDPEVIVRAIRQAEGVPSYGNMVLASRYGSHQRVPEAVGRVATRRLVDLRYEEWVARGRQGDYLDYLRDRYAPIGARNDPTGLNRHWLPNVLRNLGVQQVAAQERPTISPAQGMPETAVQEAARRGRTLPAAAPAPGRAPARAEIASEEQRAEQMRRLRADPNLPQSYLNEIEAESRRLGVLPEDVLYKKPRPGFVRGFLGVLPGMERIEREREARRQRLAEVIGPERRIQLGLRPPTAPSTAEVLREPTQEPAPGLGARVGEFFGGAAGFAALAPALEGAIGARFGAVAARGLARSIAAAASEGAAYGIVESIANNYNELRAMSPEQATQFVATRAGISGAEFAAFSVGFRAVHGLIRRGILTKQAVDEIAETLRGTREEPLVSPPRRPGEAPPPPSPVEEIRARRARAVEPLVAERAARVSARGEMLTAEVARRSRLSELLEARRQRQEARVAAVRPAAAVTAEPTVSPTEAPPAAAPAPAPVKPAARPAVPAEAPPVALEPPAGPPPPRPTVVEEVRRRRRREGVFTVAQIQGDATARPIEERATVRPGRRTTVGTPAGTEAEAQFAVVEAESPTISHTETATGAAPNPQYPGVLQRRQRERVVTLDWLRETSERLKPEWLGSNPLGNFGAPVIGRDGVVEAGNGRLLLLRRLYRTGHPNAETYRTWLRDNASEFGLRPEDIQGVKNPVLVRIRRGTVPDRVAWTEELNIEPQAAMSATELAVLDADRMTPELLSQVRPSALTSAENRSFVRSFIDQVVPTAQRGRVVDAQGNLSQEGATRIRNALFARAYGTEELGTLTKLTEATDDATRNLTRALIGAAPKFARVRQGMEAGDLWPDLDIVGRRILGEAVDTYARLKEPGSPIDVPTFLQQGVLLQEAAIPAESREFIRAFHEYRRSGDRIQNFLEGVADEILAAGSPRQTTLVGEAAAPPLSRILEAGHRRIAEAQQPELFRAEPPKTTPEQIASNLDEFLNLPDSAKRVIARSLDTAVRDRDVRTLDAAILAGRRAYDLYQKDPTPGKPALTKEWFEQFAIARHFGEPGALEAATIIDAKVPLEERLNAATRNPDATVRQFTPKRRGKKKPHEEGPDLAGQGGFLRLADLASMTDPARAEAETARGLYRGWVRQSSNVVRQFGREGADMVRRWRRSDHESTMAAGDIQAELEKAWGGRLETAGEAMDRLRSSIEGTSDVTLTSRERKLLDALRPYLNRMVPRAREAHPPAEDMPLLPSTSLELGPQRAPAEGLDVGFLPNYWPIMVDEGLVGRRSSEAVRAIMERTGADAQRAEEILHRFLANRRSGRPFGNLERRREDWAPYSVRLPALTELTRYITGAERRVAQAKWFGANDEIMNAHIGTIRTRNPQDAAFTTGWFDAVTGMRPKEAYLDGLAKEITGIQAGAKMVLSVFGNATQTINIALAADLSTFARAWRKILSTSQMTQAEAREFATSTGAVLETTMREVMEWTGVEPGARLGEVVGERTIRNTGFLTWEQANRVVSAVAGRDWAQRLAQSYASRAVKGLPEAGPVKWWRQHRLNTLERHLRKLDLDPELIAQRARDRAPLLTQDETRLAGLRMVEITQFRPSAGELPLFWNSPWGRVTTQFKRFAYKQGQLIWDSVVGEARHGNFKPLLVFLSVFPLVGEAVADIRLLIRRGISAGIRALPEEGPSGAAREFFGVLRERPRGLIPRALENLAYVGGIGLASDMIRALEARAPDQAVTSFLAGPTGSDVYDLIVGAGGTVRDMEKIMAGEPTQLGGPRKLARKGVQLVVTPGLTGAFGLPGAAAGKAIEAAPIFRTPEARQRELARRIADAIARGDRDTARNLQQQHKAEFGRSADVGAILRARRRRERPRRPQ